MVHFKYFKDAYDAVLFTYEMEDKIYDKYVVKWYHPSSGFTESAPDFAWKMIDHFRRLRYAYLYQLDALRFQLLKPRHI